MFDAKKNPLLSALEARRGFINCKQFPGQTVDNCKQFPGQTVDKFFEELRAWADTVEYYGGGSSYSKHYELVSKADNDGIKRSNEERRKHIAKDTTLVMSFISGADHQQRYGTLITSLPNSYAMGKEYLYPIDITSAYGLLVNYKTTENQEQ
ncbi:hypothetical protein MHU86_586 [Fragilaria crotonensis]|nr:hypothetical protein MHU86_586 [Fragilaria crotonensis]